MEPVIFEKAKSYGISGTTEKGEPVNVLEVHYEGGKSKTYNFPYKKVYDEVLKTDAYNQDPDFTVAVNQLSANGVLRVDTPEKVTKPVRKTLATAELPPDATEVPPQ